MITDLEDLLKFIARIALLKEESSLVSKP